MLSAKYSPEAQTDSAIGTVQFLRGEGNLTSGYWTVSPEDAPEPFSEVLGYTETLILISGKLGVSDDAGNEATLLAGDSVSLEKGTTVTWTVLEPLVKFWVHH